MLDKDWNIRSTAALALTNKTDLPNDILLRIGDLLHNKDDGVRNAAARALTNRTSLPPGVCWQSGKHLLVSFAKYSRDILRAISSLSVQLLIQHFVQSITVLQRFSLLIVLVLKSLNSKVPIYIDEGNHLFVGNQGPIPLINLKKNMLLNDLKAVFTWATNTEGSLVIKERHHTPEIALSLAKFGAVFYALKKYDQTKILLECALPILEQAYGYDHKEVINARANFSKAHARISEQQPFILGKRKTLNDQGETQLEISLNLDPLISEQNQTKKAKIESSSTTPINNDFFDNSMITDDYKIFGFFTNSPTPEEQKMEKMQLDYAIAATKTETEKGESLNIDEYDTDNDDIEEQFEETEKPEPSQQGNRFNKK